MEDTHTTHHDEFVGQYDNIGWRNDGGSVVQYKDGKLHMNELHDKSFQCPIQRKS